MKLCGLKSSAGIPCTMKAQLEAMDAHRVAVEAHPEMFKWISSNLNVVRDISNVYVSFYRIESVRFMILYLES
jgi:hypothetical protein